MCGRVRAASSQRVRAALEGVCRQVPGWSGGVVVFMPAVSDPREAGLVAIGQGGPRAVRGMTVQQTHVGWLEAASFVGSDQPG